MTDLNIAASSAANPVSESPELEPILVEPALPDEPEPGDPVEPAVEPESGLHTDTPTLLEELTGTEVEAEPVEEPAVEVQPDPVVYELQLPEGVPGDAEVLSKATELFREHSVAPEAAQKLIDFHAEQAQRFVQNMRDEQHRVFAETRRQWRNEVMADAEMGGAGHETAMQAVGRMRDLFVPEADRQQFNDFLRATGAGDHPAFLRLLHRVARLYDEARPAPVPTAPAPQPKQGNTRRMMYDHPTSTRGR